MNIKRVRCTINQPHSTPCEKAEFEPLHFFQDIAWKFFLSVSGKICHSPLKKVKRQPTLIISFSKHSQFFRDSHTIQAEIQLASYVTLGVGWGVYDKTEKKL